jgi:gas vesicle protein
MIVGVLPPLLAALAAHREGQGAQPTFGDVAMAFGAAAVGAILEPGQRAVDAREPARKRAGEPVPFGTHPAGPSDVEWLPGALSMHTEYIEDRRYGHRDYRFALGLLTGTVVGAGLALAFAPRLAAELRARVTDSAKQLRQRVSDRYGDVSTRIANVATEVTRQGQDARDTVADAVAHGAHEVERFAKATKTR